MPAELVRSLAGPWSPSCGQHRAGALFPTVANTRYRGRTTYSRTKTSVGSTASAISQEASDEEKASPAVDEGDGSETGLSQVHLATGFPVPLPRYPWVRKSEPSELRQHLVSLWARRRSQQQEVDSERVQEQQALTYRDRHHAGEKTPIQPVYRVSPYTAEIQRALNKTAQASILFVDEGNHCRSVLAEAVFHEALMASPLQRLIKANAASIGPTFQGGHDSRVMWVAQKAGLTLTHRNSRPFDEHTDIVNYDLVLTMDHFDMQEVHREVAVFDAINPGGGYSSRVQQLGSFAPTSPAQHGMFADDIPDPLYGNSGGAQERQALLAAVHQLRLACRGLLSRLLALHTRCSSVGQTLQQAIAQSVQDPSFMPNGAGMNGRHRGGGTTWRPVWRKNGTENAENFYTIRMVNGQRQIVKRRSATWGYWSDARNVRQELDSFMLAHPSKVSGKLPSQSEMRRAGCSSLSFAITRHGGYAALFARVPAQQEVIIGQRREGSHWDEFSTLARELQPYLQPVAQSGGDHNLSHPGQARAAEFASDGSKVKHTSFSGGQSSSNGSSSISNSSSSSSGSSDASNSVSNCESVSGAAGQLRMPSQQELTDFGRMDLLHAVRLWGGFTTVADRLGVLPNTRHKRTCKGLRQEVEAVIIEQGWEPGRMPKAGDLQAAGKHRLVAAIRLRGGFRVIAAQLGLKPAPTDRRGRPRKEKEAPPAEEQQEPESVQEQQLSASQEEQQQPEPVELMSADEFQIC